VKDADAALSMFAVSGIGGGSQSKTQRLVGDRIRALCKIVDFFDHRELGDLLFPRYLRHPLQLGPRVGEVRRDSNADRTGVGVYGVAIIRRCGMAAPPSASCISSLTGWSVVGRADCQSAGSRTVSSVRAVFYRSLHELRPPPGMKMRIHLVINGQFSIFTKGNEENKVVWLRTSGRGTQLRWLRLLL
jgi:hypothetical protein